MTSLDKLTPAQAFSIASQWGSYMNASDPGAAFYAFRVGDARPNSEEHREALKTACVHFLERLWGTTDPRGIEDGRELFQLWRFFSEAELQPTARAASTTRFT